MITIFLTETIFEGGVGLWETFENIVDNIFWGRGMGWSVGIVFRIFLKIFLRKRECLSK